MMAHGRQMTDVVPRPFLKWVGGKNQLLDRLLPWAAAARPFSRYHEPFFGGGALFFAMFRSKRLTRKKAILSDANANLMDTYEAVKADAGRVIELLKEHAREHGKEYYYEVRANVSGDLFERAARIIYLNRTCFNGLYRENSKGLFNVPMGRYKNPMICDERNLREVAKALKQAELRQGSFEGVLDRVKKGDFVYFDPPYHPVSGTANFTSYDKSGFGEEQQRRLAEVVTELDRRGVKVLVSNSYTPFIREQYKAFTVGKVLAARLVNSRADRRGKVEEALIRNFKMRGSGGSA